MLNAKTGTKTYDNGWRQWMTENFDGLTTDLLLWMTKLIDDVPHRVLFNNNYSKIMIQKKSFEKHLMSKKICYLVCEQWREEACLKLKFN